VNPLSIAASLYSRTGEYLFWKVCTSGVPIKPSVEQLQVLSARADDATWRLLKLYAAIVGVDKEDYPASVKPHESQQNALHTALYCLELRALRRGEIGRRRLAKLTGNTDFLLHPFTTVSRKVMFPLIIDHPARREIVWLLDRHNRFCCLFKANRARLLKKFSNTPTN
jgi:hypothetical protein